MGSHLAGEVALHLVLALIVLVNVLGLVEVAADGVDDEEQEGHDEYGQHDVDCRLSLQHYYYILLSLETNKSINQLALLPVLHFLTTA